MYLIVIMKGSDIVWQDIRVQTKKSKAQSRLEFLKKHYPNKEYKIIRFTKFQVAA